MASAGNSNTNTTNQRNTLSADPNVMRGEVFDDLIVIQTASPLGNVLNLEVDDNDAHEVA